MDTSPSSNSSHRLLIALVVVSLLASLGTMGLFVREQNRSASAQRELLTTLASLRSTPPPSSPTMNGQPASATAPAPTKPSIPVATPPTTQQTRITTVNNCTKNGQVARTYTGLCFDYPSGWVLASYNNEFTPQQKDLRITSEAGRLFSAESSGGPGEPGVKYFQNGYQLNIMAVRTGATEEVLGSKVEGYGFLYRPAQPCQEVGCPTERYFFRYGDRGTIFQIDVNYKGVTATEARGYLDTILKSLNEGP